MQAADAGRDLRAFRWRVGRKLGRTVFAQLREEPSDDDVVIGLMDSVGLALEVVASHNAVLRLRETSRLRQFQERIPS